MTAAVDQFKNSDAAKYARLDSAEFSFQTVKGKGAELDVKPYFFSFGFSVSQEVTHTFTFTYKEAGKQGRLAGLAENEDFTRDFVDMISQAAESAKTALSAMGLPLDHVDLSVQFAVKRAGNAGLQAPIQLVTLGGSVKANRDQIQSVKLTFKRKGSS